MDPAAERAKMVTRLQQRGAIEEPETAAALQSIPRHEFVPEGRQHLAYRDMPLPIGRGQTISAPHVVGRMAELLELDRGDEVLEVGTGCGYHAAVVAEIVGATLDDQTSRPVDTDAGGDPRSTHDTQRSRQDTDTAEPGDGRGMVCSVEYDATLASRARRRLTRLGYNVRVRNGDGRDGWPEHAPFDHGYLTCAVPEMPDAVVSQVRPRGYVLAPVGNQIQTLVRLQVTDSGLEKETFEQVRFVPVQT